jgi:hypothetical protein
MAFADKAGLAIHDGDRPFVASRCAETATIAFFLVDPDDRPNEFSHVKKPPVFNELILVYKYRYSFYLSSRKFSPL